ncbi:MAG: S8 family serine peptidase [Saprospiraceae bacterium]|nr:S8 family serine peptidase [Saprospiraceae bacterium]
MRTMKVLITVHLFLAHTLIIAQSNYAGGKYSEKLSTEINLDSKKWVSIHIVLSDQLDYNLWNKTEDAARSELNSKQRKIVSDLKKNAERSQQELLVFLGQSQDVAVTSIQTHWIANVITCRVKMNFIPTVAAREDVRWVGLNSKLKHTAITEIATVQAEAAPNKTEKGLIAIGAPEMWALGYTGYGRLAFIADTGTDPKHPAISYQYNGLQNGNMSSWYSFGNSKSPYDCDRHGTHVTGTILGLDRSTNDTIGVAFNSKWIAGDILCGIGTEDNIGAFEWALDPDGNPETTSDIPDVINNSWYDPSLTELDCYSVYLPILESLEAAGIAVVFSAGNSGPEENTITPPHNININEVNSFTVGALNGNSSSLPIASFSSNGPSHCPGEGALKIKPEVSAPGVQVRSCVPGGDYALFNGTSMAAPHVSGAILLLKEAYPYLSGKELKLALYHSARDLGVPGEDNKFGMGIINVYDAYLYLLAKGYQPVPGLVANDVLLLDVKHAPVGCENKLYPQLLVENSGTDTLTALEIHFEGLTFDKTYHWEGILAPKDRSTIQVYITDVPDNRDVITITLMRPNGREDSKPLNNMFSLKLKVSDRFPTENNWLFSENICANSIFYLKAPETLPVAPFSVKWYDKLYDGDLKFEGKSILVEEKAKIESLYAELQYRDNAGISPKFNSTGKYEEAGEEGLIFDANSNFTLDTFTVYSEKIGIRQFYLYDENGDSITSTKKYINKIGANVVKLNWSISAGQNYRIVKKDGKALFSNQKVSEFPIQSADDIVTIRSGTNGNMYNYFYNWKISYTHPCGRVPFLLEARKDTVVGSPEFELSTDTLFLPGNSTIQIKNTSKFLKSYLWDMGDGKNYTEENVEHNYESTGTYNIVLSAIDEQNCLITTGKKLVVLQTTSSFDEESGQNTEAIKIYPNPVKTELYVLSDQNFDHELKLQLTDINGKNISVTPFKKGVNQMVLDVENVPLGVYLLKVVIGNKIITKKIVRL